VSELLGAGIDDGNKKLNRITASFSDEMVELINTISDELNISRSEVVERLCRSVLKKIVKQKELIELKPLAVAFEMITGR